MGQRALASVTLCWGLISIPVKLYLTASAEAVKFKQITPDGNTTKQKIFDSVTDKEVDRKTLQKGYEHAKGQYVFFSQEEVASMHSSKSDSAELVEFVPSETVDVLRIEKTLHVAPDKGADKAYLLLSAALEKLGQVAVAKWYSRGKEHLITIAPRDGGLLIHQMYYENEMRDFSNNCAKLPVSDQELALACQMIEQGTSDAFGNPDKDEDKTELYRDNFIDRVNAAVQTKLAGGTIEVKQLEAQPVGGDLMAALQASLKPVEVVKTAKKAAKKAAAKKAPRKRTKKAS